MGLVKRRQSQRLLSRCKISHPFLPNFQVIFTLKYSHSLGGSDTTAGAIRTTMLYIVTSPHVYTTLQAEIDATVADGRISSPVVRDAEARTLPYLQAVIKEGLRIFPPATELASKVVPPDGDTINGVFVPGGTKIGQNLWALL
jgi:cytochrome P450